MFSALREHKHLTGSSIYLVQRRPFNREGIVKYAARNGISLAKDLFQEQQETGRLTDSSPSYSFDGNSISVISERFFHDVVGLVQGSFESNSWKFNGKDAIIISSSKQVAEKNSLHDFLAGIDIGCSVAQKGGTILAFQHWNRAFNLVPFLITGRYHDHLPNILQKINDLNRNGYNEVARSLQNHIARMSQEYTRQGCKTARLYKSFESLNLNEMEEIEERLMKAFQKLFEFYLGQTCYNSFVMMMNAARKRLTRCSWISLDECLPKLEDLDQKFGPAHCRALDVIRSRLSLCWLRKEYRQITKEAPVLVDRAKKIHNDSWQQSYFLTKGYYRLGSAQQELGEYHSAKENLSKAAFWEEEFRKADNNTTDIFGPERRHIQEQLRSIQDFVFTAEGTMINYQVE